MTDPVDDFVLPFQIDRYGLRGRLVRLGPAVDTILGRHDYPLPVARLLGEATALGACLSSTVKFDGIFTLQAKGEGPVTLLVTDVTGEGALRGYASFDRAGVDRLGANDPQPSAARLIGGGRLAFTVDQEAGERYQGIVSLEGETLADAVSHYFRQSEQIQAGTALACGQASEPDGRMAWRATALMVQRLPRELGESVRPPDAPRLPDDEGMEEGWRRAMIFLGSATTAELLDPGLEAERLLFRLFHEDGVRVFAKRPLFERCRCNIDRAARVLASFPRREVEDLKVDGVVTVTCEFCTRSEVFTDGDLDRIYGA